MLLSRSRPAVASTSETSGGSSNEGKLPKLGEFLDKKDFLGALTLLEVRSLEDHVMIIPTCGSILFFSHQFQRSSSQASDAKGLASLVAYCCFHLGDYKRALEEYQSLLKEPKKGLDDPTLWLNIACCLFSMGMYVEANEAAVKGTPSPLKNRLSFHLAHKLGNEDAVIANHAKLEELLENQLSLASMHYLRQDYQNFAKLDNDATGVTSHLVDLIVSTSSAEEVHFVQALLQIPREYIALNVYVALCYHRLEYFDVSQEVLAVYLQAFPGSAIALNLRACNTFRLYTGAAAEKDLKPLLNLMNQEDQTKNGMFSSAYDLIRHNLVVFRGGQGALQILPKLVDVIPEARFNLIIYYLQQDDVTNASTLIKGTKIKGTPEKILYAIVNLLLSYETGNREYLQTAQSTFNQVGSSENEHDSVFGRLCMASAHFLSRNFDHASLYMNSVRQHYYNDDTFNFNYAQAKGMLNQYQEVEELLTMIQSEKIRNDFTYMQWLARAYIMNKKPRLAWELHERMETSPESFRLLQLIANECYRLGQFYYAAKAFDLLERYEPSTEHWEGKRGAIIGVFQLIIAGHEPKESLHDIIALLRNSSKPNAEKILGVIKKWAKENRINL
ncbi:Intraflagellar transport protein 56 [Folsomia candida]|uniref:Intraflagellar transport protein 56 n=1 Tax=Folsomia candida TaxID=158441 RepID=A0A226E4D7_FOLCA|nr:Intraflagellar transport protein 56 [Folsomia candida]